MYQVLRKLKQEEVVVLRSKRVSLSHVWINKMADYFATAKRIYTMDEKPSEDFLQLRDGDKISYTFKNPAFTDMFWGHAMSILTEVAHPKEPVYIYNPHEWFLLARKESEKEIFDLIKKNNRQLFVAVGNRDALDRLIAKEFDGKIQQYYMSEKFLFPKNNYYLNVFGDFLIEVWLDQKTSQSIDRYYKNTEKYAEESGKILMDIIQGRGKNKLTISCNAKKAGRMKRMLNKYFYIDKKSTSSIESRSVL